MSCDASKMICRLGLTSKGQVGSPWDKALIKIVTVARTRPRAGPSADYVVKVLGEVHEESLVLLFQEPRA